MDPCASADRPLVSARNSIFNSAHARRAGHKMWRRRKILHLKRVYGANYMIDGERWRL